MKKIKRYWRILRPINGSISDKKMVCISEAEHLGSNGQGPRPWKQLYKEGWRIVEVKWVGRNRVVPVKKAGNAQCSCACGPWHISEDDPPPKDGTKILGCWNKNDHTYSETEISMAWFVDNDVYSYWKTNWLHINYDPDRWAEIRS